MNDSTRTAELAQVVLLEATFSHRGEPLSIPADTRPGPQRLSVQIGTTPFQDDGSLAVRVEVSSDLEEEGVLYDFRVAMVAVLGRAAGTPSEWTERQFAEIGVVMLYPFIRETVANLTGRGRFGPVWLNPFNVRALFAEMDAASAAAAG